MESLIPRLFTPPKQSFFLFGPRGTGKSTWLRQNMPDALWIDLLEADEFRSYSARPERLKELALANREKKIVVIDEIQKVPEKHLEQKRKKMKYVSLLKCGYCRIL